MPQLLQLADIMEFAAAAAVPEDAIGDEALRNVAALDEREQIEPWLRTLLHSPDRTPHGPTEIADILTTHATVGGRRRFAAFIVKGRSTPRVASREIAHQILRLKQLPGLEVVALLAVGDIQDDAQRDFIGVAHDMGCDFVVAGRKDVARLFLGDGRLCPIDGLPFADGQCPDGHRQTPEIELRYPVRERPRWQLFSVSDNSHGWARRLSATIVVDPHYPQETIREVIRQATQQVRHDRFYGSDLLRERWEGQPAHVVWIFVAADVADVAACNWMCRACWIDPSLVPEHRPNWDATEDVYEGIAIVWNAHYHEMKEALGAAAGTKAEVMESVEAILLRALPLLSQAQEAFEAHQAGRSDEEAVASLMLRTRENADEVYRLAGDSPLPPLECREYEQCFQGLMARFHDLWLFYTEAAFLERDPGNRTWLFADALGDAQELLARLRQEEQRLRRS